MKISSDEIDQIIKSLPTKPKKGLGRVLVTGATGYIGGRLVHLLLARGYKVRIMVRVKSPEHEERWPGVEIVVADAIDAEDTSKALEGIDVAYYLIHSLLVGKLAFEMVEINVAMNFREAAERHGLKQIIYLCGLGKESAKLSHHLQSRMRVAKELQKGKVPVTVLRAAIIIGSGSASFEIIKNLALNFPIFLMPTWAKTKCQPIAIEDVLKYLIGSLETEKALGKQYDIGGSDMLTYSDMLKNVARILGKRRLFIPTFISGTALYGYFSSLLTPVPGPITKCLMLGAKNEVVCQNDDILKVIPFKPLSYREAVVVSMTREEQDRIYTRWSDAYPPAHDLAIKLHELKKPAKYITSYSLVTDKKASLLFSSISKIGGNEGWMAQNWMWSLRGKLDRILLGVGSSRGRRSHTELRINDVVDFWRVEMLKTNQTMLLRAEMKLPGMAWLEFSIKPEEVAGKKQNRLSVTAYFQPRNWKGSFYWVNFLPFHVIIFKNLIKKIIRKA